MSIIAIASSEFCALGISASEDDDKWPLSLSIHSKTWSEPPHPVAVFLQEGAQITCTLGDAKSAELLAKVSRRTTSFESVRPIECAVVVEHKPLGAFKWTRDTFLLKPQSECQRLVDVLNALLHAPENELLLTVEGVGSLRVPGSLVSQAQPRRVTRRTSCATWASYVALQRRTGIYSFRTDLREASWPHR